MWKENMLEKLEAKELEFETMREFLAEIKREFGKERGISESSRVEKVGTGRKNDGGVCSRI